MNARQRRALIEEAMERLLAAVEAATAALDALDGDPDVEPSLAFPEGYMGPGCLRRLKPEGGHDDLEEACEDEGWDNDREPDTDAEPDHECEMCNWQDEGDQTGLEPHHVFRKRPPRVKSQHQNVGPLLPMRVL